MNNKWMLIKGFLGKAKDSAKAKDGDNEFHKVEIHSIYPEMLDGKIIVRDKDMTTPKADKEEKHGRSD